MRLGTIILGKKAGFLLAPMYFVTMNSFNLELRSHNEKMYKETSQEYLDPNISEDTLFLEGGNPVGAYIKNTSDKFKNLLRIVDIEFRSERVNKTLLSRAVEKDGKLLRGNDGVPQYSAITGGIPPKTIFKRHTPRVSSVHANSESLNFVKALRLLAIEIEKIIKEMFPEQYEYQLKAYEGCEQKFKVGNIFTSTISNCNINANYHRDSRNLKNSLNAICTVRKNTKGGCLVVPDYGITIEQESLSLLIYPAWKSMHGVTPIIETGAQAYRNSHIFYPLSYFSGVEK
jgi:hypothetical protein